jgi:hypothetical protein
MCKDRQGRRSFSLARGCQSPIAIGMTASTFIVVTGNPAISRSLELETGGFASPSHDGFALALWDEVNNIAKSLARCLNEPTQRCCKRKKATGSHSDGVKCALAPDVGSARRPPSHEAGFDRINSTSQNDGGVRGVSIFFPVATSLGIFSAVA